MRQPLNLYRPLNLSITPQTWTTARKLGVVYVPPPSLPPACDHYNHVNPAQPRDDVYGAYDASYLHTDGPKTATQSPIVTGTSVIAIKFKDGVVIAADNLGTSPLLALQATHSQPTTKPTTPKLTTPTKQPPTAP